MSKLKTFKVLKLSKKMLSLLLLAVMVIPTVMYSMSFNTQDVKALEIPEAAEGEKLIDCFPDINFASYVYTDVLHKSNCDTNKRTYKLTADDVNRIKTRIPKINVSDKDIESLSGIENFSALVSLICKDNCITNLDLSYNTKLINLNLSNTSIKNLDLSNNKELKYLNVSKTNIENIDLSNNTCLLNLYVNDTGIKNLDLSNNKQLYYLNISNTKIKNIDLSNNILLYKLDLSNTGISNLDLSNNTNIHDLYVSDTDIKNLFLPHDIRLKAKGVPIAAEGEKLIDCFPDENFAMLIYTNILNKKNWNINKSTYTLTSDDVTKIKNERNLYVDHINSPKNIRSLSGIESFTGLNKLCCHNTRISDLDLSKNTKLTDLLADHTPLENLILSNNKNLRRLCLGQTLIKNLDLNDNKQLHYLDINNTGLTNLNLYNNKELAHLDVSNTGIKNLDLSNNKKLQFLDVNNTGITNLNLSNNTRLNTLFASKTLADINMPKDKDIKITYCK